MPFGNSVVTNGPETCGSANRSTGVPGAAAALGWRRRGNRGLQVMGTAAQVRETGISYILPRSPSGWSWPTPHESDMTRGTDEDETDPTSTSAGRPSKSISDMVSMGHRLHVGEGGSRRRRRREYQRRFHVCNRRARDLSLNTEMENHHAGNGTLPR
jgi:hypothetical protein